MAKYIKKPVIVDAIQYNGSNKTEIMEFIGPLDDPTDIVVHDDLNRISIQTLEGLMWAKAGDYIIRGIKGEYYPCDELIFNLTYELVE